MKMPSSFFNKSPLKVLTPLIYSMGLVNMVETGLMGLVYTNILYPGWGRKILQEKRNSKNANYKLLLVCSPLKMPWLIEFSIP